MRVFGSHGSGWKLLQTTGDDQPLFRVAQTYAQITFLQTHQILAMSKPVSVVFIEFPDLVDAEDLGVEAEVGDATIVKESS